MSSKQTATPAPLSGRTIVLGVTGSIAAFKAVDVTSRLVQAGATVEVVMTEAATKFIGPLTFRGITGREPYVDLWATASPHAEPHVVLGRSADLYLIVPASASTMARIAHGLADDFVSLTALAMRGPVLIAPAMDALMWSNAATRANVDLLRERGIEFLGPVEGRLASGEVGAGRLMEPAAIVDHVKARIGREHGDLAGARIAVTAGGTREPADPVRFVGNRSTGKMGHALAEAARDRGADVVLITSASLAAPGATEVVQVETAHEMLAALETHVADCDALVMAAAVADYRPSESLARKQKRGGLEHWTLDLERNPDLIASIEREGLIKVAFAAETEDVLRNAAHKLTAKGAHLMVANDVSAKDAGFAVDTNRVVILDRNGGCDELPLLSKYDCSHRILDRLAALLQDRTPL
ncbi:MAG: bifunctional phosphopantothenoylcysteine decarboxylase/phosphopantothenate--cysteine ligase CoaBC [Chloroflexi bacterium]|nr:bifunctional phosphopantothenoylcysteine decarboxylase/phosphopantothenate--cysteine ligase CoaBC [Chloroflexota bacterium]